MNLQTTLNLLECTPQALRPLLADLPADLLTATEGPDTWSPYDVVGHLVYCEKANWIVRSRIILEQGADRRFAPFDRFAQFRESEGKTLATLLDEFARLRSDNLATVAGWNLTREELDLEGEHPAFGTVTLGQLLATWLAHDYTHIAQIVRVLAKQYRDAVGPWKEYLSIMG